MIGSTAYSLQLRWGSCVCGGFIIVITSTPGFYDARWDAVAGLVCMS